MEVWFQRRNSYFRRGSPRPHAKAGALDRGMDSGRQMKWLDCKGSGYQLVSI